jgi:aspartate aminotransferase-like enzyme
MQSPYLFMVPGPVTAPAYVMEAICRPVIHQRSSAFQEFFGQLQAGLQYALQTTHPVICLNGSGTFAVEAAMLSLFKPGDKVAIPAMGKFSQRWAAFALEIGLEAVPLGITWGHELTVAQVQQVLDEYPRLAGWVLTHCETSTGVAIDLEEVAFAIREAQPEALIVVDAVSTVAVQPLYTDAWDLDVVVTASQKGLLNPAGTAFASLSPRAVAGLAPAEGDEFWHFSHYLRHLQKGDYPFTPPTQLFFGVEAALSAIRRDTLPVVWNRSHHLSQRFKAALPQFGATLFGVGNADAVTAFCFGRVDHRAIQQALIDQHGIELAGGQGHLADLLLRVGHFGIHGEDAIDRLISSLTALAPQTA